MKKVLLIFTILTLFIFHNTKALEQNPNVNANQNIDLDANIDKSMLTPEQAFYLTHKWPFIEIYLLDKPKSELDSLVSNQTLYKIILFLLSGTLSTVITQELLSSIFAKNNSALLSLLLGLMVGIGTGACVLRPYLSYLNRLSREMDTKWLIYFLNHYNPSINYYDTGNFKLYTPETLIPFFDALWQEYQSKGKKVIETNGFDLLNEIKQEIKFKINPEKYKPKPEININSKVYVW